ncbi:MAG TPA: P-II family nitrogen regulator [Candidatus Manganitrophaceae bacterium]|nr:P-II family nitrogen regulator [Candidatus Manganitrophaceae bacterium]
MGSLKLVAMKKVEIVVAGEQLRFVEGLLDQVKVSGYTVIPDISGKGTHGLHEGQLMFNETNSMAMLITVVPESAVETILAGLEPIFERHPGVLFVSDVSVTPREYFEQLGR